MGSDGLFDSVFDGEIISTLARHSDVVEADHTSDSKKSKSGTKLHNQFVLVAKALANLASNHSMDSRFESPYSLEARSKGFDVPFWKKILGMKLTGGKLDDITVIVGQVVTSPDAASLNPAEMTGKMEAGSGDTRGLL